MSNREVKYKLIDALFNRGVFTKKASSIEYITRCPYCGDSENQNHGHFYMRINPEDNLPILFHCFKCEEKGVLRDETLSLLEINDIRLKSGLYTLNKTSDSIDMKNLIHESKMIYFNYILPEIKYRSSKTDYICDRLGINFTKSDFEKMKVIPSLIEFLNINEISTSLFSKSIVKKLDKKYIGFLTNGNSHILFRDTTDTEKNYPWVKYPITEESRENKIFYSLRANIDPMDVSPMTINLAEGVMDIISACYNLGYNYENCMNIAVSGKYYEKMLLYLVDLGLFGSNIEVNIFSDNDYRFNNKGKSVQSTLFSYYQRTLANYKYIYKEINVYYNMISKDIGVPKDKILLKKLKIK